jgi:hypothetical protein
MNPTANILKTSTGPVIDVSALIEDDGIPWSERFEIALREAEAKLSYQGPSLWEQILASGGKFGPAESLEEVYPLGHFRSKDEAWNAYFRAVRRDPKLLEKHSTPGLPLGQELVCEESDVVGWILRGEHRQTRRWWEAFKLEVKATYYWLGRYWHCLIYTMAR